MDAVLLGQKEVEAELKKKETLIDLTKIEVQVGDDSVFLNEILLLLH